MFIDPSPPTSLADAIAVIRTLRDAGHVAYLAGGCVRDRLLGIEPKDYDVATDAPPDAVQRLFRRTLAVGAAFGVILVQVGPSKIEVATFRADGNYADGRRPESVRFTTAEEDARRRDFTINGLFFDPLDDHIIDYVDGQADLGARVLRAIGMPAERFAEDHLRMLRAVRFAARFGLKIEPQTAAAIAADASKLPRIAAERVADELRRMLTAPTRAAAVELLIHLGLASALLSTFPLRERGSAVISPDEEAASRADAYKGPPTPAPTGSLQGRNKRKLVGHLPSDRTVSFALALLAALIDLRITLGDGRHDRISNFAPTEAKKWIGFCRRQLKLSNEELGEMEGLAGSLHGLLTTREPPVAMLKRFLAKPYADAARLLLAAVRGAGEAVDRVARVEASLATFDGTDVAPAPLLTGDMLVEAGAVPGRVFKTVLETVYDLQLEGQLTSASEALDLGLSMIASAR